MSKVIYNYFSYQLSLSDFKSHIVPLWYQAYTDFMKNL